MKSTFNICFYAKKDKQKANGAYPLFARITVDGVASRFNTKLDVLPSIWDGKMGKATGRTSEASRINRMLDDINASLNTIYHEMQRLDGLKNFHQNPQGAKRACRFLGDPDVASHPEPRKVELLTG